MSCVPNNIAFTPCQMAALRSMSPEQQRKFAEQVGLSHRLSEFQGQLSSSAPLAPIQSAPVEFNPAYGLPSSFRPGQLKSSS